MNPITPNNNSHSDPRYDESRVIHAPRGTELSCKNWLTEAAYRMIQNNLDPEVAENPKHLVVYGGIGRAARELGTFQRTRPQGFVYVWTDDGGQLDLHWLARHRARHV